MSGPAECTCRTRGATSCDVHPDRATSVSGGEPPVRDVRVELPAALRELMLPACRAELASLEAVAGRRLSGDERRSRSRLRRLIERMEDGPAGVVVLSKQEARVLRYRAQREVHREYSMESAPADVRRVQLLLHVVDAAAAGLIEAGHE